MNKNKQLEIANFLEELSWLLDIYKNINLKDASEILRNINVPTEKSRMNLKVNGKTYLVGVLPKILQDETLFNSNNDMLVFAEEVLRIKPSRAAKRSRIEYIGWIVCEVANTEKKELNSLYQYLNEIFSNELNIVKIKNAKRNTNFSWNEIIRKL